MVSTQYRFEHYQRWTVKLSMSETHNIIRVFPCMYLAFLVLAGAGLGGCATASDMQLAQSHMHLPMKIVVMQSPMKIDPGRLQKVLAPDSKKKLSLTTPPIAQGVAHSEAHALAALDSTLAKQPDLLIVTPPANAKSIFDEVQDTDFDHVISQDEATRLQTSTGADAILRFGITDYGLTPKSWRSGYITFEVVSTLAITALIASAGTSLAKGAAGAYLAQETVEETAESYAGFWALDDICRPVRIEAKLIRLNPVSVVWQTSDTGLSDVRLTRLTRKVGSAERIGQLDQASDHAVNDVVSDLSHALEELQPAH